MEPVNSVASSPCLQRSCLGNERVAVWRHRSLLCSNARCGSAGHGTEKTPLPLLCSVYSVARRLAVGYLATLCCVIQQWVDMSQYYIGLHLHLIERRIIKESIKPDFAIWKQCEMHFISSPLEVLKRSVACLYIQHVHTYIHTYKQKYQGWVLTNTIKNFELYRKPWISSSSELISDANKQTNSVASVRKANYTDRATTGFRRS
jgi:hypothetical protein